MPACPQASELRQRNEAEAERLAAEGLAAHTPLAVAGRYAASYAMQRRMLLRKFMGIYNRSPQYSERAGTAVPPCLLKQDLWLPPGRLRPNRPAARRPHGGDSPAPCLPPTR